MVTIRIALAFRNGLEDCHANGHVISGDTATSCKTFVNFGTVTPDVAHLCQKYGERRNIAPNFSCRKYSTDLHQIFRFGISMGGDDKFAFVLPSSKGRCYDNQVIFGTKNVGLYLTDTTSILCVGVPVPQTIGISQPQCTR